MTADPLELFLAPVRQWFQSALGEPTPAQRLGWPSIAAGRHTLILAPTGSGKTLAAFLACLDGLWRSDPVPAGVRVLYVSPLKALNNDIHRNLQVPLEQVPALARDMGTPLPEIRVGLRTGDTPPAERQRLVNRPPHVLITTPESLHLLLTSRARDALRNVTHCIVDEIHSVCANKRGVFLSLLLERLASLTPAGFVRIGLSATQRPLDEVARYLGGAEVSPEGKLLLRPVTIVDAGLRKDLDIRIVSPVEEFGPLPERSIWPSIYRLLGDEIRRHRSTIIFANNRRTVERITANLNETAPEEGDEPEAAGDRKGDWLAARHPDPGDEIHSPGRVPVPFPYPNPGEETNADADPAPADIARAHHGSIALEIRQATEQALKEGRLRAVVATASLELGIDMGAVDLVCQVESPGSVSRGLQRVGRAGHLVGHKSKGRLIPKTLPDLVDEAVLAREMAAGRVEEIRIPTNCLDVLAQQIVAMIAMEDWDVRSLYDTVRRAYPYRDLTPSALDAVLEMMSGRYTHPKREPGEAATAAEEMNGHAPDRRERAAAGDRGLRELRVLAALQPRVSWDRIHNRLSALPGTKHLALVNGGTIPDTGQYAAVTGGGVRVGELDEEFVYESRVGDTFTLGTNVWRVDRIEADRVVVAPAEGVPAGIPFWHGEQAGRSPELGLATGRFLRELAERLDAPDCQAWLEKDYFLDPRAARNLRSYVARQLRHGALPTDRTLVIEASRDPLGDWQVILLSPWGSRLHLALRLAVESLLRERLGYTPQCLHHDNAILVRLADAPEPIVDLLTGLTPENVEALVVGQLAESALFTLRFRQNAARALLLPRGLPGKRSPLWLQRLRGRDLLHVARRYPDFPVVAETFRECTQDYLDVPRLRELLRQVQDGQVKVVARRVETPSPFAASVLFAYTAAFMYQYDRAETGSTASAALDQELLNQLIGHNGEALPLDPKAVERVERGLRGIGRPPRTAAEAAEWLRRLGDVSPDELEGPADAFLRQLEAEGRALRIVLDGAERPERWIAAEDQELYRRAFGLEAGRAIGAAGNAEAPDTAAAAAREAAEAILSRFLDTHALVGLSDVLRRYPFDRDWAQRRLEAWAESGRAITIEAGASEPLQWSAPVNFDRLKRGTLSVLRREIVACPPTQFAGFLLHWQGLYSTAGRDGFEGLLEALDRLEGYALPAGLWERTVLPSRVPGYQPRWLDDVLASGEWTWIGRTPELVAFWRRASLGQLPPPVPAADVAVEGEASRLVECLRLRGASFCTDLAQEARLPPSRVREGLWELLEQGLVTNDRFDVVRRGRERNENPAESLVRPGSGSAIFMRSRPSRRAPTRPEGRWWLVPWGRPEVEAQAIFRARLLLRRYGIVARELAHLDPGMPPWRILYEVLSRMEMAGEVRRGYFVEGLSGAQFVLPEAARGLQDFALPAKSAASALLVHSLDPANLYGSGAPFDIPLLDGGSRTLLRRPGNWLVLCGGSPVLIAEREGRHVTALASAGQLDLARAVACLARIPPGARGRARHRLRVEEWNGEPVASSPGRPLLEAAGFVRDYQAMTRYAGVPPSGGV